MSPNILHKTEFKAVKLNLSKNDVLKTFDELKTQFQELDFRGVLITPQQGDGVELIVGTTKDQTFGLIVVYGIGDTLVEVFEDVTFGRSPISRNDSLLMIESIQHLQILNGPRNLPKVDRAELADFICKISEISIKYSEFIKEMDFNPVRVTSEGIYPLDARVILEI